MTLGAFVLTILALAAVCWARPLLFRKPEPPCPHEDAYDRDRVVPFPRRKP